MLPCGSIGFLRFRDRSFALKWEYEGAASEEGRAAAFWGQRMGVVAEEFGVRPRVLGRRKMEEGETASRLTTRCALHPLNQNIREDSASQGKGAEGILTGVRPNPILSYRRKYERPAISKPYIQKKQVRAYVRLPSSVQ